MSNVPLFDVYPGPQTTAENVPLTFSSQKNNEIEASASSNDVGLSVADGKLTLSTTSGLSFINGTGNGQSTVEFAGTAPAMNAALNGLVFTPTTNFTGSDPLTFITAHQILGFPTTFTTNTISMTVTPAPPTVATAAAASPSPVTGVATTLSVLGADDAGEANLKYTWATTGTPPAAVVFSDNGNNAAQNTIATFSKAGTYNFQVTITDAANLSTTSSVTVSVDQTLAMIAVSPGTPSLNENQTQQFSAIGYDQFGSAMSVQPAFTWSKASGIGSIDSSGLYTAPYGVGSVGITATSGSVSGSASITVINAAPTVATVAAATPSTVTAASTALSVLGADDGGESNLTYSWSVLTQPTGAPAPSFSLNGSNAAKNTTVTFGQAGTYLLQATITDAGGLSATSSVNVTVDQTLTSIAVSPANSSLGAGAMQQFSAVALDQFGQSMLVQPAFTWTETGEGSIDSTGLYTSPVTPTTATVYATSGSVQGSAGITLVSDGTAVAPESVITGTSTNLTVFGGATSGVTYTWSVIDKPTGAADPNFSVNGSSAALTTTATFFDSGNYTFQVAINNESITTQDVNVTVQQTLSAIVVSPGTAALNENGRQQFSAIANDQFGDPMITQPTFAWAVVAGLGAINDAGLFTAAGSGGAGTATISATVGSVSGTASIDVTNAAPTVATPAASADAPVTGSSTLLSILGADDGGESNLTYAWGVVGTPPAAVNFSINNSNAAKNTFAQFSKAGTYYLLVTITDAGGLSTSSAATVVVDQSLASLTITPSAPTMYQNAQQQFSADAFDQFGSSMATPALNWSISSGDGSISTLGLYTSPDKPGLADVTVSSGSVNQTTTVTIANAPPTIAIPAAASATVVDEKTTNLRVLGADDGGEANLIYIWSTTGTAPAAVIFSSNNTNASKNVTAAFAAPGTYHLLATIVDAEGASVTSGVTVQVVSTYSGITVTPANSSLGRAGSEQFSATAVDQFGLAMHSQPTFTWSTLGNVGSIDSAGFYTAPNAGFGTATIIATSGNISGSANVSLIDDLSATVPASQATGGNQPLVFSNGNPIYISDDDPNTQSVAVTVTLAATGGVISLAELNGVTLSAGTGSNDTTVTLNGSLKAINSSLHGLKFTPTAGFSGPGSISVTIDEISLGQNSPTKSVGIYRGGAAVTPISPVTASTSALFGDNTVLTGILDQAFSSTGNSTSESQSNGPTDNTGIFSEDPIDAPDALTANYIATAPASAPAPSVAAPSAGQAGAGDKSVVANRSVVAAKANSASPAPAAEHILPPAAPIIPDKQVHTVPDQVFTFLSPQSPMLQDLDAIKTDMASQKKLKLEAGSATVVSLGASAAYLIWLIRGGSLLSSFLSMFPAWKSMDPLPVLENFDKSRKRKAKPGDDESIESLVEQSNENPGTALAAKISSPETSGEIS
ncbi:MAG: hypothetical protein ABSB42_03260 [Tepidisphaeraceae bacterium]|jgi:hypothetical protein